MLPYYLLVFIPLFFAASTRLAIGDKRSNKLGIGLFFVILIILLSLRDVSVGIDLFSYRSFYHFVDFVKFESLGEALPFEVGYSIFSKIASIVLDNNFQLYLTVLAIISIIPFAYYYAKESDDFFLTIALFLSCAHFNMLFSALRQSIAIALVVPAYYMVKKKKIIPFVLIVLLAMTFHQSAAVMLFIYPIYHIRITKWRFVAITPIFPVIWLFNEPIFEFFVSFMNEDYQDKYGTVTETGAIMMILLFSILVIFAFLIVDEQKMDKDAYGLRNLLIVCLAMQLFAPISHIAMRMNFYFMAFIPIAIPRMIKLAKSNLKQVASLARVIMGVVFIVIFLLSDVLNRDPLNVFPYEIFMQ